MSLFNPLGREENGLYRYSCQACAYARQQATATFNHRTDALFEGNHCAPGVWIQIIHHWQLGLPNQPIARALELAYNTVEQACNCSLDSALYEAYHLDPQRRLSGRVEVDELYQNGGAKGRSDYVQTTLRQPRRRSLSEQGTGQLGERPPAYR